MAQFVGTAPAVTSDRPGPSPPLPVPNAAVYPMNKEQLKRQLRALGADWVDLRFPETHAMPYVLHPGEEIRGIVYGRYKRDDGRLIGRGALLATNERVLLLDKKPTYIRLDEVVYDAVSGITYGRVWFTATIMLHTKSGDIKIRTLNQKSAQPFVAAVEASIFGRSSWKMQDKLQRPN